MRTSAGLSSDQDTAYRERECGEQLFRETSSLSSLNLPSDLLIYNPPTRELHLELDFNGLLRAHKPQSIHSNLTGDLIPWDLGISIGIISFSRAKSSAWESRQRFRVDPRELSGLYQCSRPNQDCPAPETSRFTKQITEKTGSAW